MVAVPDRLRALVTADLDTQNGTVQIELPAELIAHDALDPADIYRIAILATDSEQARRDEHSEADSPAQSPQKPPVDRGETRTVTIDTLGDQGDGIARVERGYVIIVPDVQTGDKVVVEIESVQSNVAFATIVEQVEET